MNLAEALLADRARRREGNRRALGRARYAELADLTEQRIWALEHGSKLKAGELDKLKPLLGDLLDEEPVVLRPTPSAPLDNRTTPVDSGSDDYAAERRGLEAAYSYVMQRLHGHPQPPYAWPSQYRIEAAPVADFPGIRAWIQSVHEWLDGVGDPPTEETPAPPQGEPTGVTYLSEPEFSEDWTEWLPPEEPEPDREPVPTDGPDYHADHDAWAARQPPVVLHAGERVFTPREQRRILDTARGDTRIELNPELRYFTNSELKTWKQCRRRWWLGSYRHLGLRETEVVGPANVGTRVHRVLQGYYVPEGTPREDPWDVFEATVQADQILLDEMEADEDTRKQWRSEVDLARAIVDGYFDWAEENAVDANLRFVEPEATLVADPKFQEYPTVRLLAKLDVRAVRTLDNARVFVDHKTVQDLTSPQKTLHLDEQMLHYHLIEYLDVLARGGTEEQRTHGAIYNMLRKVKRTANARPPFYGRVEVHHNLDELRSYWLRVRQTVRDILEVTAKLDAGEDPRGVVYPNPTRDCSWKCEFFAVCPMFDDGSRVEDFVATYLVEKNPLARYGREAR